MTARTPASDSRRSSLALAAALAVLWLAPGPAAGIRETAALYDELQLTKLDPARAVLLKQVDIEFGSGLLRVHDGVLVPTQAVRGRTVEWVFVGQARFRFDPPDEIEADQLELFAGQRQLDVSLEAAVMVRAADAPVRDLLEHHEPAFLGAAMLKRVEAVHREWLEGAERAANGIRGGVFNALIGDHAYADYFAIWCRSFEVGDFIYEFDPEDTEPHTLAHFSPLEIRGWDRLRLERHLKHQQKRGRWLDTRIQDIGDWDIWLSGPWDPDGTLGEASPGFEAQHYELDVRIGRNETTLHGSAKLDIVSHESGRRVIPLELFRDLRAETVTDANGESLFFFRSGGDLMVVLPEPSRVGQKLRLDIVYRGKALRWVDRKMFDLEDTANWYPHCGTTDRATYDVTLRWPRGLQLLASGRVVDSGRDGRTRWQRRVLEEPAIAFSFVLGRFEIERARAGHVALEVAFNRSGPHRLTEGVRREMISAIRRSLEYFEETFGPYPLDYLTVVTLPRRYSQSFLGFITIADSILPPNVPPGGAQMNFYRATTVAHEVAHQWWGNLIGWSSYRDQWLSEAMANYSALQFWADTEEEGAAFFSELSAGWRQTLNQTTPVGRTVESLGPIVLGVRLNSTLADNGYRAIVYRKGAVVLAMLARIVGQRPFSEMMRSLAGVASNRVVSTATFLRALEHMSGLDLSGFAQRYIYGTGIPEVYYDYKIDGDAKHGWTIEGEARLAPRAAYDQAVRAHGDRHWDVVRAIRKADDATGTALVVPYRILLDDGHADNDQAKQGNLMLEGPGDRFRLETKTRPLALALDPSGEILAGFYSARTHPKKVAALRAQGLLIDGDGLGAEAGFRRSLAAAPGTPDKAAFELQWLQPSRVQHRREDALTYLRLARLALDRGDETLARAEIAAAVSILGPDSHALRIEIAALEGRIDLRHGNYESAFKRSKKALRLFSPRRQQRYWRLRGWQAQVGSDWPATTDVLAILAVAAFETGNNEELRWALDAAGERGVDLSVLRPLANAMLENVSTHR
ncbi:MAG: hypothetical protein GTN89_14030 [Acidobacteria bacterium]|nr:hypothetical protein [Acidobacteriota bacterium]NIM60487.1 hypothetical protein [Acidobacteriota bacterium]NIO60384.1 hypothetical protein [Acidobacteriota bacterium]NIQ31456.1 hypothetical protein [Acidobacteriota bacterium]NIQ86700.1 hypothetical protein [Acidobacteriota bacterium]